MYDSSVNFILKKKDFHQNVISFFASETTFLFADINKALWLGGNYITNNIRA